MGMATGKGLRNEINVTPLIDVVLVLLIIFMVVTPLMQEEFPVSVPEQDDQVVEVAPDQDIQLLVRYKADGSVLLNYKPLPREELEESVRALLLKKSDKIVFFEAEDDANFGEAIAVMDALRSAGAKTIGFVTTPPAPETPTQQSSEGSTSGYPSRLGE
ncbi:MAG: biopolymer transporter ExbD [Deltaproteobacteria bacterium]|nr:MAG: biopolymer transporter ExbD [Deltaproteobacteria bacterium]